MERQYVSSLIGGGSLGAVSTVSATLWLVVLLAWTPRTLTESFTSIAALKDLVAHEEWLLDQLDEYIEEELERLQTIQSFASQISNMARIRNASTEDQWEEQVNNLVEHPLGAFSVIRSWYQISEAALDFRSYTREQTNISLPEQEDYQGAIKGLLRLQKTYKLPSREMAQGQVYGVQADHDLELSDLLELGVTAMDVDHYLAMSWFDLALEQIRNNTDRDMDIEEMEIRILTHRLTIYEKSGDTEGANMSMKRLMEIDPENYNKDQVTEDTEEQLEDERPEDSQHIQLEYWKSQRQKNLQRYEALCRGDNITNSLLRNKNLMCIYRQGVLPYVRYKEEIHRFSPRISLIIDVISDRQADLLVEKAFPSLNRSRVGRGNVSRVSDIRNCKLSWLADSDPEVAQISRKVSDITGLNTALHQAPRNAELLQIANYGIGGQYEPHHDFSKSKVDIIPDGGDRLATFMFYLSDVQAGGATVFPVVGVRIPPVKNAAAFWYNFDLAGESGDMRTVHAGCPVLLGQKWVGNKWILQKAQMFKRPCGLNKDQRDPIWNQPPKSY